MSGRDVSILIPLSDSEANQWSWRVRSVLTRGWRFMNRCLLPKKMAENTQCCRQDVDTGRSWIIAFLAMWDNFWNASMVTASSVLYVSIQSTFGVSREQASWPFTMFSMMYASSGLLAGILAKKFRYERILLVTCSCVVVLHLLVYIFFSLQAILICFTVIGLFVSIHVTVYSCLVNENFDRYRMTANLIMSGGFSSSSALLPILFAVLLDNYGLRGTMLISVALVSNLYIPVAYLFAGNFASCVNSDPSTDTSRYGAVQDRSEISCGSIVSECIQLLKIPLIYLLSLGMFAQLLAVVTLTSTIVDFAVDSSIDYHKAVFLLTLFGIVDIVSRFTLGPLTDRLKIDRRWLLACAFLVLSIPFFSFPLGRTFSVFAALISVAAASYSLVLSFIRVSVAEYIGMEKYAIAYGIVAFIGGLLTLVGPSLIGYFRDKRGSYAGMYYTIGAICLAVFFLGLLERILSRCVKRRPPFSVVSSA